MPLLPATTLTASWKVAYQGHEHKGPLVADEHGLGVDTSTSQRRGLKKTTLTQRIYVVAWDDVKAIDIAQPEQHNFGGSTINANTVLLTVDTADRHLAFTLKRTDRTIVHNQLGQYIAQVRRRQQG